jgi:hypothetical protein
LQVLPEYLLHLFFNVLFLCSGEWLTLALNAPLIGYHVHRSDHPQYGLTGPCRYLKRPVMSCPGLYDPTNIMNADILQRSPI